MALTYEQYQSLYAEAVALMDKLDVEGLRAFEVPGDTGEPVSLNNGLTPVPGSTQEQVVLRVWQAVMALSAGSCPWPRKVEA